MSALRQAIDAVGGPIEAARICGRRRQAIDKWLANGCLPRTDYCGITDYADKLAAASVGKEGEFTAEWLRQNASPSQAA